MNQSLQEKKRQIMERRKQRSALQKAEELLKRKQEEEERKKKMQENQQNEQEQKKKKNLDYYKMGIYYQQRSRSMLELRTSEMQTDMDPEFEKEFKKPLQKQNKFTQKEIISALSKRLSLKQRKSTLVFSIPEEHVKQEKLKNLKQQLTNQKTILEKTKFNEDTEKQQKNILKSNKFNEFFQDASKYIEKLIREDKENEMTQEETSTDVESQIIFQTPKHLTNVTVRDLQWSPLMPEVFLSVYMIKDELKVVQSDNYDYFYIWNSGFQSRPEFELRSKSIVQCAIFSPFASETIIAGTESGAINIYDLRADKDPVIEANPSLDGHRTPINGLKIIGGRNSNNLVTISEEGKLCNWSLQDMSKPLRKIELVLPKSVNQKQQEYEFNLEPFCISSIQGDSSGVYVGTCDNNIYYYKTLTQNNFQNQGSHQIFSGHKSIVNTIDHSKANQFTNQLQSLMISGSFDWTIKLWNMRQNKSLYTFNNHQNPICCVDWNPLHPVMFASSDSSGQVNVMNLLKRFDQPVYSQNLNDIVFNVKWDHSGRNLAVTDANGNIIIKKFQASFFDYQQADIKVYEQNIIK